MESVQISWYLARVIERPGQQRSLERLPTRSPVLALLGAAGAETFPLGPRVRAVAAARLLADLAPARR